MAPIGVVIVPMGVPFAPNTVVILPIGVPFAPNGALDVDKFSLARSSFVTCGIYDPTIRRSHPT